MFVNLYFPYAGWGLLWVFLAGGGSILNSNQHVWQWMEELEAMLCKIHVHDFKSVFLLSLKQDQNLMKVMFSCIHFPIWPYPPPPPPKKKKKKKRSILYQSVNSMGCQVCTKAESVKVCVCVLLGGRGVLLQLRPSKCPVPSCITISLSVYHPDSCFLCQAVSVYQCITQTTVLSVSVCYHYISV